jgi:hypothetical protein
MPRSMTGPDPSLVIAPPQMAEVLLISVIGKVVRAGNSALHDCNIPEETKMISNTDRLRKLFILTNFNLKFNETLVKLLQKHYITQNLKAIVRRLWVFDLWFFPEWVKR